MRASAFTVGGQREQVTRAGSTDGNLLHYSLNGFVLKLSSNWRTAKRQAVLPT